MRVAEVRYVAPEDRYTQSLWMDVCREYGGLRLSTHLAGGAPLHWLEPPNPSGT